MGIIEKKAQGIIGVFTCLMGLQQELSPDDFQLFCDNTPDGEELWITFRGKRDDPNAPEGYNFITFAKEVLDDIKAKV